MDMKMPMQAANASLADTVRPACKQAHAAHQDQPGCTEKVAICKQEAIFQQAEKFAKYLSCVGGNAKLGPNTAQTNRARHTALHLNKVAEASAPPRCPLWLQSVGATRPGSWDTEMQGQSSRAKSCSDWNCFSWGKGAARDWDQVYF